MESLIQYFWDNKWSAIFTAVLLYVSHRYLLRPYLLCRYYAKQGCYAWPFVPIVGIVPDGFTALKKHGDFLYTSKSFYLKNPTKLDLKATVFNFGSSAQVTLIDPKMIQEFLVEKYAKFVKFDFLIDSVFEFIGRGLPFQEGAEWQKNRKLFSNIFHFDLIKRNHAHFVAIAEHYLPKEYGAPGHGTVALKKAFEKMTSAFSQQVFLGPPAANKQLWGLPLSEALIKYTDTMTETIRTFWYLIFGCKFFSYGLRAADRRMAAMNEEFGQVCAQIVAEEHAKMEADAQKNKQEEGHAGANAPSTADTDYLSVVKLLLRSGDLKLGDKASLDHLRKEVFNFLIAGKDTTMNLVQMAAYYLATDADLYARVCAEVRAVPADYEAINALTTLDGFIKEVLRVYGPSLGIFTRVATEDMYIGELHIKKGTFLNTGTVFNHFNPKYYPDPFKIDPSRWDKSKVHEPFTFGTFSGGPRRCIGEHLSKVITKVMLHTLLNRFEIKVKEGYELKLGMNQQYGPVEDVPFILTLRQ